MQKIESFYSFFGIDFGAMENEKWNLPSLSSLLTDAGLALPDLER